MKRKQKNIINKELNKVIGKKIKEYERKYYQAKKNNEINRMKKIDEDIKKDVEILKEKINARKIQKIWRKYWYDIYKYELIDGEYIGFCRFIEKSYSIINGNSI
jgi:hypothetical protein